MQIVSILCVLLMPFKNIVHANITVKSMIFKAQQSDIDRIKEFTQQFLSINNELGDVQKVGHYQVIRLSAYKGSDIKITKNTFSNVEFYSVKCNKGYLTLRRDPLIQWGGRSWQERFFIFY